MGNACIGYDTVLKQMLRKKALILTLLTLEMHALVMDAVLKQMLKKEAFVPLTLMIHALHIDAVSKQTLR